MGVWGYFHLKENKKPSLEALSVLPDSCLVYLHSSDFFELNKKLNSQSLIADQLKLFTRVGDFCNTLRGFDSLMISAGSVAEELKNTPLHFAVYPGHPEPSWLMAFNIQKLGNERKIRDELVRTFKGQLIENEIYEFSFNKARFYFSSASGIVLVSNTTLNLLRARNNTGSKLIHDPSFIAFKNSLEEKGVLSLYVDHRLYAKSDMRYQLDLSAVTESGYSAGTIDLQPSQIKVNGYLSPGADDFISVLLDQRPQATDFVNFLPLSTCAFRAYGFSSFRALRLRLNKLKVSEAGAFWKDVNDSALYNLEEEFYLNLSSYAVAFETGPSKDTYLAVQVADTVMVTDHLIAMSDSLIREGQDSLYHLRVSSQNELRLFDPLLNTLTHYAAQRGGCLYFSATKGSLILLLQSLRNGQLITQDESFTAYRSQHFYENFNYMVYCAPSKCKEQVKTFFNMYAPAEKDPFTNFRHFSFSIAHEDDRFKFRWQLLNEAEKKGKEQPVLWTFLLDTLTSSKVAHFVNHLTQENELLVQDDGNTLYLVNAKGSVLWRKKLNETIHSEIFMVDAFKNNKYQILFSTTNYLHLIDRNGNYLAGYPLKLPAEASCGLSLFDYDHTRDYRLFISCKNKLIYNYSLGGTKQSGFLPFHTDDVVNLPVQYIKVGQSDYLVALDKEGKIYTFSRRGEGRIGLKNKTIAKNPEFYLDVTNNVNSTYLVYADEKNNSINKISFADKKILIQLGCSIEGASLNLGLLDEAGTVNLIFTTPNAILIYDLNGNLLLNHAFANAVSESIFYKDENSVLVSTKSVLSGELILFDLHTGKEMVFKATAFPWIGHLFNDHKKYAVMADGKRLNCVLLH